MPLSNAERQRRFRDLKKTKAAGVAGLNKQQLAERKAVMSEPIYPVPPQSERDAIPTFMGWNRYDWSEAPEPLIDHFDMRPTWECWQAEKMALQQRMAEIFAERTAWADAIVTERGQAAKDILRKGGQIALFEAYKADPTLGQKRQKSLR